MKIGRIAWIGFTMLALTVAAVPGQPGLPATLEQGKRVSVEGRMVGSDRILAAELEIEAGSDDEVKVTGIVRGPDPEARTIAILGVTIAVGDTTLIESEDGRAIGFDGLSVGKRADVEGRLGEDGTLLATGIELETVDPATMQEVELEGLVQSVDRDGGTFRVMGVTVMVNARTEIETE